MQPRTLFLASMLLASALAGCVGTGESLLLGDDEIEPTGRVVELRMWVETIEQEIYPGFAAELWAFCAEAKPGSEDALRLRDGQACSVPGPTIEVDQGDRLVVEFENPHRFSHTIHWHGQPVPNAMDGVPGTTQDTVEQGGTYVYDFLVAREGTLFYHCHVDTQHHLFMGLYGAMLVRPQDASLEPQADQERTLVLSHGNASHMAKPTEGQDAHAHHGGEHGSGDPGKQNAPFHVDYDLFMINGKSFPHTVADEETLIAVEEGDAVRLRFINAGFLTETMHLHGHDMLVTHKDGKALPEGTAYLVDTLRIAPGERYDVMVQADNPGTWVMHTHFPQRVTNDRMYPGGMLTAMVYVGFEDAEFRSSLPGGDPGTHAGHGSPQMQTPPPPDDWHATEEGQVTGADHNESYEVPVEDLRLGRIALGLTLEAGSPLDELTVALHDPGGQELAHVTATAEAPEQTLTLDSLEATGTYTARLSGQGIEASYVLDMLVDYAQPDAGSHTDHGGGHQHH